MRQDEDEFEVPGEIREGLRGLYGSGSARGMEERDRAVLLAARCAGEGAVWRRRMWRVGVGAGLAAAVGLVVMMPSLGRARQAARAPRGNGAMEAPMARGPMESGGRYVATGDIRDAFYVARALKAEGGAGEGGLAGGPALEAQWDVNKDGVVDGKDVQALAMAAVQVKGGTR